MPIVSAAIVPHPPLLIPTIGKEHRARLKDTLAAFEKLTGIISLSQARTAVVISPHGEQDAERFTVWAAPEYELEFAEFGDFSTKRTFRNDPVLVGECSSLAARGEPVRLAANGKLDHGASVPLHLLFPPLAAPRVLPICYSSRPAAEHYRFGQTLGARLRSYPYPVALIASGDLSHCLKKGAPGGYSPRGKKFDIRLTELLRDDPDAVPGMPADLVADALECGYRSILILLGALHGMKKTPQLLSYEAPFGVGYGVWNIALTATSTPVS